MTSLSLRTKLSLITAASVLSAALAVGIAGYLTMDRALQSHFRQAAHDSSVLMASRIGDELNAISERSRYYVSSGDPKHFESDQDLIALSVLRKTLDWDTVSRWTRAEGEPSHLNESDFKEIDLKHPVDFDRIAEGGKDITLGTVKNQSPFLRIAMPWGPKTAQGYEQAIVAEVKAQKILGLFSEARGLFSFLTGPDSQLLVASESGHFIQAENLAQLPVILAARASQIPHGDLEYEETPESPSQYAGFSRVPVAGAELTVVSQAPRSRIEAVLAQFVQITAVLAFAFSCIAGLFAWFSTQKVNSPTQTGSVPVVSAKHPAPLPAKLKGAKLNGERMNAMVVHAHLHGIEKALASADPEILLQALNTFNLAVAEAIQTHQGMVDHIKGGSVVACWGIPAHTEGDAQHALEACREIREAAAKLNSTLQTQGAPLAALGMAMHYGPVVAGQVGSGEHASYSAFGEAIELASRIHFFTHQFGTDFLMTSQAAAQLPKEQSTERVTAGDEETPELYELAA